jgi:23S rRNA pseudouridine2605 synthase
LKRQPQRAQAAAAGKAPAATPSRTPPTDEPAGPPTARAAAAAPAPADLPPPGLPRQRIAKLLARAGVGSRRDVERLIAEGRVAIGGVPLASPAHTVTALAGITVDGQPVAAPEPARLFRLNKPAGVLTTARDPAGRATVMGLLPAGLPRLVTVGRLDMTSEGLLLLTNDGALKRALELPATGLERRYRVRAFGPATQPLLDRLAEGATVDGVRYGPVRAFLERKRGDNAWIEVILTEGKNREVRRLMEWLGLKVNRLIRTHYGPFALDDLAPARLEEVAPREVARLLRQLGLG